MPPDQEQDSASYDDYPLAQSEPHQRAYHLTYSWPSVQLISRNSRHWPDAIAH